MSERLHKLLASAGFGSRREIERWIEEGRVSVNGVIAKLGDSASAEDDISIDGRRLPTRQITAPQCAQNTRQDAAAYDRLITQYQAASRDSRRTRQTGASQCWRRHRQTAAPRRCRKTRPEPSAGNCRCAQQDATSRDRRHAGQSDAAQCCCHSRQLCAAHTFCAAGARATWLAQEMIPRPFGGCRRCAC
jgi:ribosomal 50S subunit-recycling heat shock protein